MDDSDQWEQLVSQLEQTELNPSDAGAPRIPKPEEAVATSAPGECLLSALWLETTDLAAGIITDVRFTFRMLRKR